MLNYKFIDLPNYQLTGGDVLNFLFLLIVILLVYRLFRGSWKNNLYQKYAIEKSQQRHLNRMLLWLIVLVFGYFFVRIFHIDYVFYTGDEGIFKLTTSHLILAIVILYLARITDWIISNFIHYQYKKDRSLQDPPLDGEQIQERGESKATTMVQYIVYLLAAIFIIRHFGLDINLIPNTLNTGGDFRISRVLFAVLILLVARVFSWMVTQVFLYGVYRSKQIDKGSQFAINQILKYIIFLIAIILALQSLGIKMTLLLGGAAALLVGIGLGLQQTFNDFFSGLVLLFERSISVGDVLEINGEVGTVKRIGLRSSIVQTRPNVAVVIPNSKLVNDSVNNWTHYNGQARFDIAVGVAFGSDTQLVKKLLIKAASDHPLVLDFPKPFVRLNNFGESSLEFNVYFFSTRYLIVEDIKSDIRFMIDKYFRANDIQIPFPQRDIWVRKSK